MLVMLSFTVSAENFDVQKHLNNMYVSVGAGYKFDELTINFTDSATGEKYAWNDKLSARIEIGYHLNRNIKFGISHHSQWRTGFPFKGQKNEYYKTEVFVDYTINLGEVYAYIK